MEDFVRCPGCGSTNLKGDTGHQKPVRLPNGAMGYDVVDFTCKDCGQKFRSENATTPAQEMRGLGSPGLFD